MRVMNLAGWAGLSVLLTAPLWCPARPDRAPAAPAAAYPCAAPGCPAPVTWEAAHACPRCGRLFCPVHLPEHRGPRCP